MDILFTTLLFIFKIFIDILKIIQYNLSKLTNLGMNMIKFQNKRFLGRYKNVKTEKSSFI